MTYKGRKKGEINKTYKWEIEIRNVLTNALIGRQQYTRKEDICATLGWCQTKFFNHYKKRNGTLGITIIKL